MSWLLFFSKPSLVKKGFKLDLGFLTGGLISCYLTRPSIPGSIHFVLKLAVVASLQLLY